MLPRLQNFHVGRGDSAEIDPRVKSSLRPAGPTELCLGFRGLGFRGLGRNVAP